MTKQNKNQNPQVSMAEALKKRGAEPITPEPTRGPEKPYNMRTADLPDYPQTPEPTVDEITAQAMSDMRAEEAVANLHPEPETIFPSLPRTMKAIPSQPEKEKPIIPASNTDPQPKVEPSIPESVEPLTEKKLDKAIGDFIDKYPEGESQDTVVVGRLEEVPGSQEIAPQIEFHVTVPETIHDVACICLDCIEQRANIRRSGSQLEPNLRRLLGYINGPEISENWVQLQLMHLSRIPSAIPSMTLWAVPSDVNVPKMVFDLLRSPGYIENIWPGLKLVMGSNQDNIEWATGVATTMALFDVVKMLPFAMNGGG